MAKNNPLPNYETVPAGSQIDDPKSSLLSSDNNHIDNKEDESIDTGVISETYVAEEIQNVISFNYPHQSDDFNGNDLASKGNPVSGNPQLYQTTIDKNYTPDFSKASHEHNFSEITLNKTTASSKIYLVKEDGIIKVLKVYLKKVKDDELNYELDILSIVGKIDCPYLATPLDYWVSDGHIFLLSTYYPLGDLETALLDEKEHHKPRFYSSKKFIYDTFIRQALVAIKALHDNKILHKDIKPSNFFLSKDDQGKIKVVLHDFGSALKVDNPEEIKKGKWRNEFTPPYKAPEINHHFFNLKADYFSLGVTILDLYLGQPWYNYGSYQFEATNNEGLEIIIGQGILKGIIPYSNVDTDDTIENIIENLLILNVNDRWSYQHLNNLLSGSKDAQYITFNFSHVHSGRSTLITSFKELLTFIGRSTENWESLSTKFKERLVREKPQNYLSNITPIHDINIYFQELADTYAVNTFKDEHYILFKSVYNYHFSSNIYYHSYRVVMSENETDKQVLDQISSDIYDAIYNQGQFKDNAALKDDLYHFVASGALADWISYSKTNEEKANLLYNYEFKYTGIEELERAIYLLSPKTKLRINESELNNPHEFLALVQKIGNSIYQAENKITFNIDAKTIYNKIMNGIIETFLRWPVSRDESRISDAYKVAYKLHHEPTYYLAGKEINVNQDDKEKYSFMLFYFLTALNPSFYFDNKSFVKAQDLVEYGLKDISKKRLMDDFINLHNTLLFNYWIKSQTKERNNL